MASAKPPLDDTRRTTGSPKMKSRGEWAEGSAQGKLHSVERRDGSAGAVRRGWEESRSQVFGTENAKETLCRNVTIYGRCRYEDKGIINLMCDDRGAELTECRWTRLRLQSRPP